MRVLLVVTPPHGLLGVKDLPPCFFFHGASAWKLNLCQGPCGAPVGVSLCPGRGPGYFPEPEFPLLVFWRLGFASVFFFEGASVS